jgi:plasmid stabilization system protein ParE
MDFKVLLSPEALSDLESIVAYIAPHDAGAAVWIG